MVQAPDSAQEITPELVRTAVGLLSCRFGTPEAEAHRRGRVRVLLQSSREFAVALEHFARQAAPRTRGEHSSPDLHAEADAMARAVADWTAAVLCAADTYRECREPDAGRPHAPAAETPRPGA